MSAFFNSLNFASSNEDGATELAALAGPARRMLCLTGSGTRPLDMLFSAAEEVIALDLNPVQNALLSLKCAAIRRLDHAEYLAWLGIAPSRDRMALHREVLGGADEATRAIWGKYGRMIRKGIWYQGRWERVLRPAGRAVSVLRRRHITPLFDAVTLEDQAAVWACGFDDRIWRGSIRLLAQRWIWTRLIGEPGGAFLPSGAEVEAALAGRFARAAGSFFFRDSDFAALLLRGAHDPKGALPLHMRAETYAATRAGLDRLRIRTGGLTDIPARDVDAFSLSDFGSYCTEGAYAACWVGISAAAAPGARFCERCFLNPLAPPRAIATEDMALSNILTATDRAIIYRIHAGRIGG